MKRAGECARIPDMPHKTKPRKTKSGRLWIVFSAILAAGILAYGFQGARQGAPAASAFNAERAFADLRTIVAFGPRPAGSDALAKTRAYIVAELQKSGLKAQLDEFEVETPRGRKKMTNIRASRAGTRSTVIALAGHYDTKIFDFNFLGANDGGSSAAWLLEMARATQNLRLENTLEFIFFDGEEAVVDWTDTDSVYGSRYDVERRRKDGSLKQLRALILVDMIGDKNLTIRKEPQSTEWLTTTIWSTAERLGFSRQFLNDSLYVSDDHIPFLKAGVQAVDLIDFEYPNASNSHWHQASDTLDKTSGESLKIVGDVVLASLPEIDRRAAEN